MGLVFTTSLGIDAGNRVERSAQKVSQELTTKVDQIRLGAGEIQKDAGIAKRTISKEITKQSIALRKMVRGKVAASEKRGRMIRSTIRQASDKTTDQLYRVSQGADNQFNHFVEKLSYLRLR